MDYELFSSRLRAARKQKNLTQKQLADKIGVSAATLTNYETGKNKMPGADILISLAQSLDVSIDWLLGNDKATVESEKELKEDSITREDIKKAFDTLFLAFGENIEIVDKYCESKFDDGIYAKNGCALHIDDWYIQRYLENCRKLMGVEVDKETLSSVFNAIFPNGEFDNENHRFGLCEGDMPF